MDYTMQDYQNTFIELALACEALKFGEFTLKSGRRSPYFFNAGEFNSGERLLNLGNCYADAIVDASIEFDVIFGPAYKGIPLAAATATALAQRHGKDVPWCFNRKETKDHGEGGSLVGAPLSGRVLIVDDVITAGTAIREAVEIILANGAVASHVIIALDREERGKGELSAVQEVERDFSLSVHSILGLHDLMDYLAGDSNQADTLRMVREYQQQYGIADA